MVERAEPSARTYGSIPAQRLKRFRRINSAHLDGVWKAVIRLRAG